MGSSSAALCAVLAASLAFCACSSGRIGLVQVSPDSEYSQSNQSALVGPTLSNSTRTTLRRQDLLADCEADLPACIRHLHGVATRGAGGSDETFALAELSFFAGEKLVREGHSAGATAAPTRWGRKLHHAGVAGPSPIGAAARSRFLASALYAYAFLFPEDDEARVSFLDPRTRMAADLYARGLAQAFSNTQPGGMFVAGGQYRLPFGQLNIAFDEAERRWGTRLMGDFRWAGAFELEGLNNRYRRPGIGAAVAARTKIPEGEFDFVEKAAWVPATILLRIDHPREQLATSEIDATFEIHSAAERQSLSIGGRELPLETDSSVALAATLQQSRFWENNLARFLGHAIRVDPKTSLGSQDPYAVGKIPAVFVHGTDSSPATWANMVNDLQHDPRLRERYHFWFFSYDSGNPILYSSMLLRRSLKDAVASFRKSRGSGCLDSMVVIGHSQGGLLTQLTVVESGDAFWDAYFSKPFDEIPMRPANRKLLRDAVFVKPLPFVKRVVFIATPHHGSFLAGPQFVRRLAARLIQLPRELVRISTDMAGLRRYSRLAASEGVSTSIDNMSPGHPFIRALGSLPVVPGVEVNSIIALRPGESEETGSDGVVKYSSAHIDGAESELIVRSGHSVISNPHAVEEVRRILLLHAEEQACH